MLDVFLLDVVEDVAEESLVVHYQFVNDRTMNVLRREFIRITFLDYFGHLGKVTRDRLSILLYY